jgi:hypothetical protein
MNGSQRAHRQSDTAFEPVSGNWLGAVSNHTPLRSCPLQVGPTGRRSWLATDPFQSTPAAVALLEPPHLLAASARQGRRHTDTLRPHAGLWEIMTCPEVGILSNRLDKLMRRNRADSPFLGIRRVASISG